MLKHAYPKTVTLKDGREVILRPLGRDDFDRLYAFFQELPAEDRLYLRDDVRDPELIRKWTEELDFNRVVPIVALERDCIVADGTLHLTSHGWTRHVGHIRLITARAYRQTGLGTMVARELVALAEERGLEKLQVHVIEDSVGAVKMFLRIGFEQAAVVKNIVKDIDGRERNLAIMINEVSNLGRIMEDWMLDSTIPSYRIPGDGQ